MTISEFNAWLDGFEEGWDERCTTPTKAQWAKIRAKFGEVVRDMPLYTVQPQPLMPTFPSWPVPQPMRLPFPHETGWTWSTTGSTALPDVLQ